MAYLEKIIRYNQAELVPEEELEIVENGSKIQLKPLNNLVFLCHFDQPSQDTFGPVKEEISQNWGFGVGAVLAIEGKFGTGVWHLANVSAGIVIFPPPQAIINPVQLTIDFWANFYTLDTGGEKRYLVDRSQSGLRPSWGIFIQDGELGIDLWTSLGQHTFQTVALSLNTSQWYHIRAGFDQNTKQVILFLDGSRVLEESFSGVIEDSSQPQEMCPINCLLSLVAQPVFLDELRIFNSFTNEEFTPPSQATSPYSSNQPKTMLSLDSGYPQASWLLDTLNFTDETDFEAGGIKLRLNASENSTPEFSGELLTLAQVRAMENINGRYLHLEFTFISDGNVQRILPVGWVGIKPQNLVISRRAPEIIRRY